MRPYFKDATGGPLKKAMEGASPDEIYALGNAFFHGTQAVGSKKGPEIAVALWKTIADDITGPRHVQAKNRLAACYFHGIGVPVDREKAVVWWKHAEKHGSAEAQCAIGECYRRGYGGLPVTKAIALANFQKAAGQGYLPAYLALAEILLEGQDSVSESASHHAIFPGGDSKAARWLAKLEKEFDTFDWRSYADKFVRSADQTLEDIVREKQEDLRKKSAELKRNRALDFKTYVQETLVPVPAVV